MDTTFRVEVVRACGKLKGFRCQPDSTGDPSSERYVPSYATFVGVEDLYWPYFYGQSTPHHTWLGLGFAHLFRIGYSCSSIPIMLIRPHDMLLVRSTSFYQ